MREFNVGTGGVTVASGSVTLVLINPKTGPNINLETLRWWVGQSANATSAQQRIELINKASVFPTLTAATPTKLKPADPNVSVITGGTAGAIATAGTNASAEGAGTATVRWDDAFNVLNGYLKVNTPAETEILSTNATATSINLMFPTAPTTLTGSDLTVTLH